MCICLALILASNGCCPAPVRLRCVSSACNSPNTTFFVRRVTGCGLRRIAGHSDRRPSGGEMVAYHRPARGCPCSLSPLPGQEGTNFEDSIVREHESCSAQRCSCSCSQSNIRTEFCATDPIFDHDKLDVERLEVEYDASSFAIARKSPESGGRQTSVRLRPYSLLASCVAKPLDVYSVEWCGESITITITAALSTSTSTRVGERVTLLLASGTSANSKSKWTRRPARNPLRNAHSRWSPGSREMDVWDDASGAPTSYNGAMILHTDRALPESTR
jgi:hypothetical protein